MTDPKHNNLGHPLHREFGTRRLCRSKSVCNRLRHGQSGRKASYDIDGDPLTYQWSLISSPSGSSAALANTTAVSPVFTVDVDGDYLFLLTVNDGHGNTASDTVLVSTTGSSPIAAASPAQKVSLNQTASLDGSASKDPDGQTITCTWMLLSKPASSNAQLSTSTHLRVR